MASLAVAGMLALPGAGSPHQGTGLDSRIASLEHHQLEGNAWFHGSVRIGRSAQGRAIRLQEYGSDQTGRRVLVFGCIHGTECAASQIPKFQNACPTPGAVFYVPNLNPDGFAEGTRLNGRGVDLNRNFSAGWRPIGQRWDLEYSGPHPFSEPESRLAARLIRALHPDVTIWFHQEAEPLVRAWGPSVPSAKRYAHLTGLQFHHLPWLAGTAPNWQNHRFPGTASFVVELPPGPASPDVLRLHGGAVGRLSESRRRGTSHRPAAVWGVNGSQGG